jgi:hypothetical protein
MKDSPDITLFCSTLEGESAINAVIIVYTH